MRTQKGLSQLLNVYSIYNQVSQYQKTPSADLNLTINILTFHTIHIILFFQCVILYFNLESSLRYLQLVRLKNRNPGSTLVFPCQK